MVKIIPLAVLLLLAGCATAPIQTTTVCSKSIVPVAVIPAPPSVVPPLVPLDSITPQELNQPGIVAKDLVAQLISVSAYAKQLQSILQNYQLLHDKQAAEINTLKKQGYSVGNLDQLVKKNTAKK